MLLGLFVPGQKLITMALFCFIAMPWWLSSQCCSWQCRRFRWRTQTDLVAENDRKLFYFFLGDWKKEIPFSPVLMHKSSDRGCFDGGPLCHWRCSSSACLAMAHRAGASPLPKRTLKEHSRNQSKLTLNRIWPDQFVAYYCMNMIRERERERVRLKWSSGYGYWEHFLSQDAMTFC